MSEVPLNIETLLETFGHERRLNYALEGFQAALRATGSPEKNVKSLVIAGTNGKGSVSLLTTHALAKSGKRVATYLSPHLTSVTERFLFKGQPIQKSVLDELGTRFYSAAQKHKLSYFEFLTLLFFHWAREVQAEILVLEVGLGGRLDATNVTRPVASAITSIDFDHKEILGNSLEAILKEKIAIVPEEGKLISGIVQPNLIKNAKDWCARHRVSFIPSGSLIKPTGKRDWGWQEVTLGKYSFRLSNPNPRWVDNSNTAYLLLKTAFPDLDDTVIMEGFSHTPFPGRFEQVGETPIVILSGDHNPAGIESLIETVRLLPKREIHTLCAFSLDKPYETMFKALECISKTITLTSFPKQGPLPDKYRNLTSHFNDTPQKAYRHLLRTTEPHETLLITGSLYLVGTIRECLKG